MFYQAGDSRPHNAPLSWWQVPLQSADARRFSFWVCFFDLTLEGLLDFSVFLLFLICLLLSSAGNEAFGGQSIKVLQAPAPASVHDVPVDPALAEASSRLEQGKPTEADALLRSYLMRHPDSADGHFLLGHALFRQIQEGDWSGRESNATLKEEKAKASLAEFTAGASYRTPRASDLKIVALDYIVLHDFSDADKWLTRMLEWTPNDSEGWYYLGRTKYNENRFQEAVLAFQQSLKLDSNNVKTEDNLGLAYAGLGRSDDAVAAYNTAIEWQKNAPIKNPGPFVDLGDLLLDQNRSEEAIPYLHQAIQISPEDSKTHELLGKAFARLDRIPEAQTELEKAAQLAPEKANLPCMLGPIYRKQGLSERAKIELDRCASLNRTNPPPEKPRP
jgi:Flp pilus assembly protein TadD